jgi:hypothetical protein
MSGLGSALIPLLKTLEGHLIFAAPMSALDWNLKQEIPGAFSRELPEAVGVFRFAVGEYSEFLKPCISHL